MGKGVESVSLPEIACEILRETSYRLDDIYNKSFLEGGPTFEQLEGLYELIQRAKIREIKFQASIHGAEFKTDSVEQHTQAENPKVPLFRDPDEYEGLSEEEKESETKRMMGLHQSWSGDAINKKADL